MSGACHRSLYSYQMRTALALASRTRISPSPSFRSACSGATIEIGFLGSQRARECPSPGTSAACPGSVARADRRADRAHGDGAPPAAPTAHLDLVLLTIGANDIYFSGLIANVIVEPGTERTLFSRGGIIASVEDAQKVLDRDLPGEFRQAACRAQAARRRQSLPRSFT